MVLWGKGNARRGDSARDDAGEPDALLNGSHSAWTEASFMAESTALKEAEGLGYSKLRILLHTYFLFVMMGFALSAIVILATYATIPTVFLPECMPYIEKDYGSGQGMPTCTVDEQPWLNATESKLTNPDNFGWRCIYISTAEFHQRIGAFAWTFTVPFLVGWRHVKKDKLSCAIMVILAVLWSSIFICTALSSQVVADAMPSTAEMAQHYVDAYDAYAINYVNQVLILLLPGLMLGRKRQETWGITIIWTLSTLYAIFGDFISISPIRDYGLISTRTNPNYILLFRLIVFPITWEMSLLIVRAQARMFGEVPLFSTVPQLMVTVFMRAVYARLLLVQLDNVGTVLVINVLFAFVQVIGSVSKRSNDDLMIKASCRNFRMAWAYQSTKTYNHVLLSARLIEAASENAAIWATATISWYARINLAEPGTAPVGTQMFISAACQCAVALVTDFVCLVCETRYLASFKLSTIPSYKVLDWKQIAFGVVICSIMVWSVMCTIHVQAVVSMFCPTIYEDVGLLFERCNIEPLAFFQHAI